MLGPGLHLIFARECRIAVIVANAFFAYNVLGGTVQFLGNPVDVVPLRVQVLDDLSVGLRLPKYMHNSLLASSVSIFGNLNLGGVTLGSQHIVGFETVTFLCNSGIYPIIPPPCFSLTLVGFGITSTYFFIILSINISYLQIMIVVAF